MPAAHLRTPDAKPYGFAGAVDIQRTTLTHQAVMPTEFRLAVVQ